MAGHHVEDALQALGEGAEIQGLSVLGPHRAFRIVFEGSGEVLHIHHGGIGALAFSFLLVNHIGQHQAHLVRLVAVPFHREPGQAAAVRAPHRMRVIAAFGGYLRGFPGEGAVEVDAGIGGEGVLLAFQLLAGVGDVAAVRAPAKVCYVREGAVGQLELDVLSSQDVHSFLHHAITQRSYIGVRDFRHPVVPVAVHQVLGGVGLGLVQQGIRVRGHFHGTVYIGYIHHLGAVRGQLVIVYSAGDIGHQFPLSQLVVGKRGLEELAALQEEDGFSVGAPAGRCNALAVQGERGGLSAFHRQHIEVADAAVFRHIRVAHPIEDGFLVRGKLGIAQAAQRQEHFGGHPSIGNLQPGRADITFLRFHFLGFTGCEGQYGRSQRKEFTVHI